MPLCGGEGGAGHSHLKMTELIAILNTERTFCLGTT